MIGICLNDWSFCAREYLFVYYCFQQTYKHAYVQETVINWYKMCVCLTRNIFRQPVGIFIVSFVFFALQQALRENHP